MAEGFGSIAVILAFVSVISVAGLFITYYSGIIQRFLVLRIIRPFFPSIENGTSGFISEKLTGIICTGIIPVVFFIGILNIPLTSVGFKQGTTYDYWYLVMALIIISGILTYFFTKDPGNRKISLDLSVGEWHTGNIVLFSSAWIIYIFGYEFLFRGILWFLCFGAFGLIPALIVNVVAYALVHVNKGLRMTLGAIPAGIVFCLLSNLTGSFLPAFFIHASMALMGGLFSFLNGQKLSVA